MEPSQTNVVNEELGSAILFHGRLVSVFFLFGGVSGLHDGTGVVRRRRRRWPDVDAGAGGVADAAVSVAARRRRRRLLRAGRHVARRLPRLQPAGAALRSGGGGVGVRLRRRRLARIDLNTKKNNKKKSEENNDKQYQRPVRFPLFAASAENFGSASPSCFSFAGQLDQLSNLIS